MNRRGFSLLEILLAIAILGASLAVLSSLVITGADAASDASDLAVARMLCETKMNEQLLNPEIVPLPLPLSPIDPIDTPDTGGVASFQYSIEVQPAPAMQGLLAIRVTVSTEELNQVNQPKVQYSLIRWMVDPALGLEQLERDAEAEAAAEEEAAATASDSDSAGGEL